jgi:hypothetical protein
MITVALLCLSQIHEPSAHLLAQENSLQPGVRLNPADAVHRLLEIDLALRKVKTVFPTSAVVWAALGIGLGAPVIGLSLLNGFSGLRIFLSLLPLGWVGLLLGFGLTAVGVIALARGVARMNTAKEKEASLLTEQALLEAQLERFPIGVTRKTTNSMLTLFTW